MIKTMKFKLAILLFRLANYLLKDKIQEHRQSIEDAYADADWDSLNDFYDRANEEDYTKELKAQGII
ncbi:hypothetical protein CPAST_c34920 [Clostridium pasteurianum DSM 525 = ATCC 6013]|uniref:Uncharacterized protein n=1 Tax=Clostridium pasteurianum DSM 525 = ATCC 6013 TaxID=1262449 RepID=A0A0H3JAH4_CLOPA|nr:hypothetical protein [Clostridium pasteurianum]AJA49553.1 hypothetical protein CPAST_c34920 [Clostridium pasteurianum DSM 525 = ATCC 6013]AJA53541.1 hypothetical protein CLPA_c34920 [Clostridium pasteurianum DSM 525 = ATCC 6013]AOZ76707.1 hypothetical protein AQ983_16955 [Clostridium pasteurianum DSM 525 = ATCC 6013]AOZ80504.1 hypothetical protein AQ984_16950 [Clostridium pasteurianum]ELP58931.1 hypothetical protein F502_12421 [Clostridium pasteurianum DSM 525 = ATCC 6013]